LLRYGIAFASVAAGILHLTAASAHSEHTQILAFFIGTGIAQIVFGTALMTPRPPRWFLRAAALGNTTLIAVWLASRMSGLPFVAGVEHAEPVGVKDTVTVVFELLVVVGCLALASGGRSLAMRQRLTERGFAPLAAATALLIVPGLATSAHVHSDEHMHGGGAHGHTDGLLAAGHEEHATTDAHGHAAGVAGHTDDAMEHADHAAGAEAEHTRGAETKVAGTSTQRGAAAAPAEPEQVTGIKANARYGPFVLPPAGLGGDAHYNRILSNVAKPCSDCYIVSMRPNMVYADGSSANLNTGTMLHHAVWTRPNRPDATCSRNSAIGSQGERFFASGNERTEMTLPAGFGYRVGNDGWNLIAEIMNHSDQARTVYVTLDVLYRPLSDGLRNVTPVWMDIDNCGDSQYAVPAGKSNKLWTWRSTVTGRVVSTGGHVHDGGVKTVLTNETTKQQMCTSVAGYGMKPEYRNTIESMSTCVWDRIGVLRKGEQLGLRAYYDTSAARTDVMGINIAFVYETTDLSGGTAPPRSSAPQEQTAPPPSGGHDHP